MEIIYFILGIVFAIAIYSIVIVKKIKTSYLEVSDIQERMQIDTTSFIAEINSKVNKSLENTNQIKEELEKDSYKNSTELSKQFLGLKEFSDVTSRNFIAHQKLTERNNSRLINDVNALKRNLKAMGQDPNMLSRY